MNGGVRILQSKRQGGHGDRSLSLVSEGCDRVKSSCLITALKPALRDVTHWAEDSQPWAGLGAPAPWVQYPLQGTPDSPAAAQSRNLPEFGVTLLLFNLGPFLPFPSDPCPSQPAEI